ncbi:MAG: MFS transporter [Polyangiaceae bacterium]|nr:MFS transporter [Polyangiaceae bacterium]
MSETRATDRSQVIPFAEKFGYALGDFASNLFWMPFILYGAFFYTDVFGISATAVGWMLLVTRVWDTVIDPLVGMIADRTKRHPRLGQYRPYLFWVALPFGFVSAMAFYTPDFSPTGKLVYAWVTYTTFCIVYSLINVPYSALMSVMSKEPVERNSTSFFRMIGAQSAGLLISLGLMFLVAKVGGGGDVVSQRRGFFLVMSAFALLAVICFLLTGMMTRERIVPEEKQEGEGVKDLMKVFANGPWLILFFVAFFTIAAFTMRFGVAAYYFKYYADQEAVKAWGEFQGGAVSAFFTFGTIASLLGVTAFGFFAKKMEKKKMYYALILASGAVSTCFYFIPNDQITLIIATQALFSFLSGPTAAILFAMYTDIAASLRNDTGSASNGLVMAAGSLSQKFGWAVGGALTSLLLGWAGYVADMPQTPEVKHLMSVMMSWVPMGACTLGALFMFLYPLDDRRMLEITKELEAKGLAEGGELRGGTPHRSADAP